MRATEWLKGSMLAAAMLAACGFTGCKSLTERYIALEVWKYERCFGHLPPGFVPPNAQIAAPAAPAMRPCGQPSNCCPSECPPAAVASAGDAGCGGGHSGCNDCQGGMGSISGGVMMGEGMPAGGTIGPGGSTVPSLPAGPGGSPGPMTSAGMSTSATLTSSRPVVISDEVVLP